MTKPLDPPDLQQCQAEKPNGNTFMTLGGQVGHVRCKDKPTVIAYEREVAKDGCKGSMSLCDACATVMREQLGEGFADYKPITTTYRYQVDVEMQGTPDKSLAQTLQNELGAAVTDELGNNWDNIMDSFEDDGGERQADPSRVSLASVENSFYNTVLGVPFVASEDERKLQEIAEHYVNTTEAYDRTVCTEDRYGEAFPADGEQRRLINEHARREFTGCLCTVEHVTRYGACDLRRAINRVHRRGECIRT